MLCCSSLFLHAQVDSLLGVFNDASKTDSVRAEAMFVAASAMSRSSQDTAMMMRRQLWRFGKTRNSNEALALSCRGIGYSFYVQRQMDSSEFYFLKAVEFAEKSNMQVTLSKVNYNLIFVYHSTGEKQKGVDAALRAIAAAKACKDNKREADALQQLGQLYQQLGEGKKALKALQDALVIAEELENKSTYGFVLGSLGVLHYRQGESEKGIEYSLRSIEVMKTINIPSQLASGYGNLAMMYNHLERWDEALDANTKNLAISREIGDMQSVAITLMNMGIGQSQRGEHVEGMKKIKEAYSILEKEGDAWPLNASMKLQGMAHAHSGNHDQSKTWCLKALKHSRELGLQTLELENLHCVYEAYENLKDYPNAFKYYQEYKILQDSLFNEDRAKEFARQETQFEYSKQILADSIQNAQEQAMKDAQIAMQNAQIKSERTQRFTLYGGLALLVLFGGAMFNRFQVTRRQRDLIDAQKSEVETQRDEIHHQKDQIEEKSKEIMDSIKYAKRIQTAILPPDRIVKEYLSESFILYKPKDIVAGDFYWMETREDTIFFAAADCTGHGVPGAMVSVICNNGLNRSVREFGLRDPALILDKTRELVIQEFEKSDEEVKDGMDISLCALNTSTGEMTWAGANNPLWVVRGAKDDSGPQLEEIKADKQPIGKYDLEKPFTTHHVQLHTGDTIYIFSDGFPDQFGGANGKKYKSGNFKKKLVEISSNPINQQKEILDKEFEQWRGDQEQIDDVCVIGVRI